MSVESTIFLKNVAQFQQRDSDTSQMFDVIDELYWCSAWKGNYREWVGSGGGGGGERQSLKGRLGTGQANTGLYFGHLLIESKMCTKTSDLIKNNQLYDL